VIAEVMAVKPRRWRGVSVRMVTTTDTIRQKMYRHVGAMT
jgi:hypothetical protein